MHLIKSTQFWVLALCPKVCEHLPSDLEMLLCVSGTSKNVFGAWDPNRSWDIDLLFFHVFAQLRPVLGPSTLPAGVSTPVTWSRNVSMCLRDLQKYLVYGALMEAEILTSLLIMYLLNVAWFCVLVICLWVCQHLPSSLQMFLYVSGTSKKYLVYGDLIETEILISPPQGICSTCPCYWALALYPKVCQHLPSSLIMFLCVLGTSKKYLVHGP